MQPCMCVRVVYVLCTCVQACNRVRVCVIVFVVFVVVIVVCGALEFFRQSTTSIVHEKASRVCVRHAHRTVIKKHLFRHREHRI